MIKTIIIYMLICTSSFAFIFDDERGINFIPYEYLPDQAKNFVEEYFNDYIVHNTARTSDYIVIFKGGSSIYFNNKGEWKNIIGNSKIIPMSILEKIIDKKIIDIIKAKYKDINSIYKKKKGYEFKVDNEKYIYIDFDANILKVRNV